MPTTNNNWPTPVATDLVKDGWEAIKDLGDAIDTTLGVYAPSTSGLTLINTTSFSGVSSQSVNDVFSATYENYHVVFTTNGTDSNDLYFRIRVAGSDLTSSTYTTVSGTTTTTTFIGISGSESRGGVGYFDIFRPFATDYTHLVARASSLRSTGKWDAWNQAGAINNATSYTGFTLYPTGGTITGTIRVYGYNN
jgi:hypothetical protein